MSIEKWKDWFELIALVAVIGSLIAVVVELRQTQTVMQAQVYQARAFDGIEWNMELAKDESLRGMQTQLDSAEFDPATLTPSELSLARHLMTIVRIDLEDGVSLATCHPGQRSEPRSIGFSLTIRSLSPRSKVNQ
jgi:hypothetical protein